MKSSIGNNSAKTIAYFIIIAFIALAGCTSEGRGFALPEGDTAAGMQAFKQLECTQCHSVGDVKWTGQDGDIELKLGGEVTAIKTYGELLTSVINPSHKISRKFLGDQVADQGQSKMPTYNEVMTVQQLVDIVTFLQSEYNIVPPPSYYPYY